LGEDVRPLDKISQARLVRTKEPSKNVLAIITLVPPGSAACCLHQNSAIVSTIRQVAGMPIFAYLLPNLL
jgi:hypothetical protein